MKIGKGAMEKILCIILLLASPILVFSETVELKLAVVVPLRSNIADIADDLVNGAKLAAIHEPKKMQPWPGLTKMDINLELFDDSANKDVAKIVANQLVARGVDAVIGHFNSGTAIPASEIYEKAGVVNISTGGTNPKLTDRGFRYSFRIVADDFRLSEDLWTYLGEQKIGRVVAVINDATTYGMNVTDGLLSQARKNGKDISDVKSFSVENPDDIDWSRLGASAASDDINVVFLGGVDLFASKIIDHLPSDKKCVVVGGDGLTSKSFAKYLRSKTHVKAIAISQSHNEALVPMDDEFVRLYTSEYSRKPTTHAAVAYDAVHALIKSISLAHSVNPKEFVNHLHKLPAIQGVVGLVAFDGEGNNIHRIGYVHEIENGESRLMEILHNGQPSVRKN